MKKRRIALFVFWEKAGIVRNYVKYYLTALRDVAETVVCIVNGDIRDEDSIYLREHSIEVVVRPNVGIDFGAWQDVIHQRGWSEIEMFDELILCNCSSYGPLYSLESVFQRMEESKCDFWGMTRHKEKLDVSLIPNDPHSVIYDHLQSYFMVFRRQVLQSPVFQDWWNKMRPAQGWLQEVAYHECRFTKYLTDNGFSYKTYLPPEKYDHITGGRNASMICADTLLEDGLPFIKRKYFTYYVPWTENYCHGHEPLKVLNYIQTNSDYPLDFIWNDLLSTQKLSDIRDAVSLNYIFPFSADVGLDSLTEEPVVLLVHVSCLETVDYISKYISSMPEGVSLFVVSAKDDILSACQEKLNSCTFREYRYIHVDSDGFDTYALIAELKEVLPKYSTACFINDYKVRYGIPEDVNMFLHDLECCLLNSSYVKTVINYLKTNRRCGLLMPSPVYHTGAYMKETENIRSGKAVREVYKLLDLQCPMDDRPVTSYMSCFWANTKALAAMYRSQYDEAFTQTGQSQSLDVIIPIVAQNEGYYTATCMSELNASVHTTNMQHLLREYSMALKSIYGNLPMHDMLAKFRADYGLPQSVIDANLLHARFRRKRRQYRLINILSLGLTYWRNKRKLHNYKRKLGLSWGSDLLQK